VFERQKIFPAFDRAATVISSLLQCKSNAALSAETLLKCSVKEMFGLTGPGGFRVTEICVTALIIFETPVGTQMIGHKHPDHSESYSLGLPLNLKTEAVHSPETSLNYPMTQCHIQISYSG
jgi:hypothetical protein